MLDVSHIDGQFALAYCGRVQIQSFRTRVTAENLQMAQAAGTRFFRRLGNEKFCTIAVISANTELPDQETRKLAAELMQKIADKQTAAATVLEGDGFWAGAARAAISGVFLLSRATMAQKPFATIEQAAVWVGGYLALQPKQIADLVVEVNALRQRHLAFV